MDNKLFQKYLIFQFGECISFFDLRKELDDTILKLTQTISSVQNLAAQPLQAPQPEKSDEEKVKIYGDGFFVMTAF